VQVLTGAPLEAIPQVRDSEPAMSFISVHRHEDGRAELGQLQDRARGEGPKMRRSMTTARCCLGLLCLLTLTSGVVCWAGAQTAGTNSRIMESDVAPQSRPLTFSQLLDDYLATLQDRLKHETRSIPVPGLVEVKLTIRRDGAVTFSEVVVLDGPLALRGELLPLLDQLNPLPPPPVSADLLDVSVLLPLQYPSPDLLDSIGPEDQAR
jgi:hypothetical protein